MRRPAAPGRRISGRVGAGVERSLQTAHEQAIPRNFRGIFFATCRTGIAVITVAEMMRRIEGKVQTYTPINVRNVQIEIQGSKEIIDLRMDQPWVLKNGDHVVVVGEDDGRSGKFNGYAYRNDTRQVHGRSDPGLLDACRYLFLGFLFAWAIFPLFIHVPHGWRLLAFGRKVDRAAAML